MLDERAARGDRRQSRQGNRVIAAEILVELAPRARQVLNLQQQG